MSCFLSIEKKKRILLIDLDPQGNLTQCFKLDPPNPVAMDIFLEQDADIKIWFQNWFWKKNIIPTNIRWQI
ncbi:AAA family ATPase (plasmid) [Spiroplasma citri]|nr:AAA family ATPase [Spiroplasma citri]